MCYTSGTFLGWLFIGVQEGSIVVSREMVRYPKGSEKKTLHVADSIRVNNNSLSLTFS